LAFLSASAPLREKSICNLDWICYFRGRTEGIYLAGTQGACLSGKSRQGRAAGDSENRQVCEKGDRLLFGNGLGAVRSEEELGL